MKSLPQHGDEKGPWYVIEGGNFIDVSCRPDSEKNHRALGFTICEVSTRWPFRITPRHRKIARLIAAAPALLAALEELANLRPSANTSGQVRAIARAAIAKVKGKP